MEEILIDPPKLRLKLTLPFLARIQFESLQRGELDPFLWRRASFHPFGSPPQINHYQCVGFGVTFLPSPLTQFLVGS